MKIKCLIVDDEPLAGKLLQDYLKMIPEAEVAGYCKHPVKALEAIRDQRIDLMFLDIQMPDLTGFELLRSLPDAPLVIITTAFSKYAVDGYTFDVVDYLLKPVPFDRFLLAFNKASERLKQRNSERIKEKESLPEKSYMFIKSGHKMIRVGFEEILFIEAMGEYVAVHITGRKLLKADSMKNMEELLPADQFIRIHKSYIVAVDKVHAVYGNTVEIMGQSLPVGRFYKETVQKIFS